METYLAYFHEAMNMLLYALIAVLLVLWWMPGYVNYNQIKDLEEKVDKLTELLTENHQNS